MTAAILHPADATLAGLVLLAGMVALLLYVHIGRYIQRHLDRALEPDDDREPSECDCVDGPLSMGLVHAPGCPADRLGSLPIHDEAVAAIQRRGGWAQEWTP